MMMMIIIIFSFIAKPLGYIYNLESPQLKSKYGAWKNR